MKNYPDFWHTLLGTIPPGSFLAYFVIALLGATASVLWDISKRDVTSAATPVKFSLLFLVAHNVARFFADIIALLLVIRALLEWDTHPVILVVLSILFGFGIERLCMVLKNSGILATDKLGSVIKDKLDQGGKP